MGKQFALVVFSLLFALQSTAQSSDGTWRNPEAAELYSKARTQLSNGNIAQAITLYTALLPRAEGHVFVYRELAQAYSLQGKDDRALAILEQLIQEGKADEGTYNLTAGILQRKGDTKKARKTLNQGIRVYPASGLLYHTLGKIAEDGGKLPDAAQEYRTGIQADAAYHLNYYDAGRMYFRSYRPEWAMLYAEIFINLERETPRSYDARRLLVGAYKKLFLADGDRNDLAVSAQNNQAVHSFGDAVALTNKNNALLLADGFDVEHLTMLRIRFLAEWEKRFLKEYPYALFDYWKKLLQSGHFEAYNQWLFGATLSETEFNTWKTVHGKALAAYQNWAGLNPLIPRSNEGHHTEAVGRQFKSGR